jgi:hypothetical protein
VTEHLDPLDQPAAEAIRPADRVFLASVADPLIAVHANESNWWNHGSFALPLLGGVICIAIGLFAHIAEATGFGLFLGAIALFMLPVVLLTWRSTPTAIILTQHGAISVHQGTVLRALRWDEVHLIDRVDTLGNIRWRIHPREGQHLAIEGEIADVPGLIETAQRLSAYRGHSHEPASP